MQPPCRGAAATGRVDRAQVQVQHLQHVSRYGRRDGGDGGAGNVNKGDDSMGRKENRDARAWAAFEAWQLGPESGNAWPEGVEKMECEVIRDEDAEMRTAATTPIYFLSGRRRLVFTEGDPTCWT